MGGDALGEELSKWREAVFASRVLLCQARAAPGLPPLPLSSWMLNQLFVWPRAVQGTNPLAEGWGKGTNKGFAVGMVGLFVNSLLQACAHKANQTAGAALSVSSPYTLCWRVPTQASGDGEEEGGRVACSCVPPSSARPRAATSPTCRERGGRWETGRQEQTSCRGAKRQGQFLSQVNSPDWGSWRGACPASPGLLPCSPCSSPAAQETR